VICRTRHRRAALAKAIDLTLLDKLLIAADEVIEFDPA
jgi:hypothetical protein